jgi:hypothetical protein
MPIEFDYRYEDTLRINFPIDIDDDSEMYNKVNDLINEFLGSDIEIDWRDSREVEIHRITDEQKHLGLEEELIYHLEILLKTKENTLNPPLIDQLVNFFNETLDDDVKYQIVKNLEEKGFAVPRDAIIVDQGVNTMINSVFKTYLYDIVWTYNDYILDIIKKSEEDKDQLIDKILSETDKKLKI